MPIVTKEMSKDFIKAKFRPNCIKCGKFIGEGGYYDVIYDDYMGGYEEGYSLCKKCYSQKTSKKSKDFEEIFNEQHEDPCGFGYE